MYTLNKAWKDLTDEEFFWEPLPGSWSVRRRSECLTPTPFGTEDWVADFDAEIRRVSRSGRGQRASDDGGMAHVAHRLHARSNGGVGLPRRHEVSRERLDVALHRGSHPVFTSADEAVQTIRAGWRALDRELQASTDEQLERQTRFWGYPGHPGPPAPAHRVIALKLNEISHHGTQVCMLRDLYRARDGGSFT